MQRRLRHSTQAASEQTIFNLNELTFNEPVVHLEHGIGRYQGLETLTVGQETAEYMCIIYQER